MSLLASCQENLLKEHKVANNKQYHWNDDPLDYMWKLQTKLNSAWIRMVYPFASIGRQVSFHPTSKVYRPRASRIRLGNSISLREYAWLSVATDDPHGEPTIVIDDNCHIGFGSIISAKNNIHLERDVLVGQMVLMVDHNHAYEDINIPVIDQGITEGGRIRIAQGAWIGHGACIICPRGELRIGRNCVIAANSMVMRSIPDYSVAAGYPATVIRQYDPERKVWLAGGRRGKTARETEGRTSLSAEVQASV